MKRIVLLLLAVLVGATTASTMQPGSAELPAVLDASRILPGSHAFELRVGGKVIGTMTLGIERSGDGFLFNEATTTPSHSQTTEVRFGRDLRMTSVRQNGRLNGAETHVDVAYAGGRATGTARIPGAGGLRDVKVDASVPPNVIDDNLLVLLLPAMPWAAQASWTVPVFASGKGTLTEQTFRVGAIESIDTPSGAYRTYRADVSGGEQPVTFFVTADAPHQLVKLAVPGSPLEIVRTSPLDTGKPPDVH